MKDWGIAVAAGGLATAATLACFLGAVRVSPAVARWQPASRGLQLQWDTGAEEARLMDPSALFLPGEVTAAAPTGPGAAGRAVAFSRLAEWSPPELAFGAEDLRIPLPPPVDAPASAAEALNAHPPGNPAAGFARSDAPVPVLAFRAGEIEVTDLRTGTVVLESTLPGGLGDGPSSAPETSYLSVSPVGPVGVFAGDGGEAARAQKLLDAALGPGHRLPPGSYRISIGP